MGPAIQKLFSRDTILLRMFGLARIPLLFLTSPTVEKLSDEEAQVRIPLNWVTKNHYGSMYFGALAIGADCAAGLLATHHIKISKAKINLLFKDFKASFIKRPDKGVLFICGDGRKLKNLVEHVIGSKERQHERVMVTGRCGDEVVAQFELTISLKMG